MSSHNNQQRRVARRFKRTMQAQQRHQRGRIDGELCVMLALAAVMVICALTSIAALCVALDHAACTSRIDWSAVPVASGALPTVTDNQRAFVRMRRSEYAALAFERAPL